MSSKPSGPLTFLLTDIEASTALLQLLGDEQYAAVLADHLRLLRSVFDREGATEIGTRGDGLLVAFLRPRDAVVAAVAAQQAILNHPWPDGAIPRIRMGLHTGEAIAEAGEHVGLDLHRTARICEAGHGGQVLASATTGELAEGRLPAGVEFRRLGPHRLRDLQKPVQLFQVLHPELPSEFPPLRSLDSFPNNLPRQMTSFIGRERELEDVKRLLSTTAVLMLTGSGGCGKTRLALQAAADLIDRYADGIWLVELAALTDPSLVLNTVASALGLRKAPARTLEETLIDYLHSREILLVLDNCEHLLLRCAGLVETLTRSCRRLRVLATSREPFDIPGEKIWSVPSLSLPPAGRAPSVDRLMLYEATRLFVERAMNNQPAFTLTSRNSAAVLEVCRRLDGIPLAIELAAARMRALSVEQIAARLDERFRLLTGGGRTALPRQQTLRGALDWSYDLLSGKERILLQRLAIFAGAWTLEGAEAVCAGDGLAEPDILDLLTQLVFKSLVLMDTSGEQVRYRMLETVRQYGQERLNETGGTGDTSTRHRDWYLRLAQRAEPELSRADQAVWLGRLEEEHDNLRAALEWSKVHEPDGEAGLRLAKGLWQFWYVRGDFSEGRVWLETMLTHSRDASALTRAQALAGAGFLAYRQGDYDGSTTLCVESLSLFHTLGDLSGISQVLYVLGSIAEHRGDYEEARARLTESLAFGRQLGEKRRIAISLNSLGEIARCQGDHAAARAAYEESLHYALEAQDKRAIATAVTNLGYVALKDKDAARASKFFEEALVLRVQLVHKLGIAENLAGLGGAAALENRCARAATLLAAAKTLLDVLGANFVPPDQHEYDGSVTAARAGLDEQSFANAWGSGKTMTVDQAVEYAINRDELNPPPDTASDSLEMRRPDDGAR